MTDSFWETRETATTSAECDTEGQRSVYNMGQFPGMGGTKVGTTMQEADWFYLVDASAEIVTTGQQMATDQVMKKKKVERGGQTASHKGMRLGQVS